MKVPLSVIIPIKNEAPNLPRCLSSISWADQIFVVDSESTDGSGEIAGKFGAVVVQFNFKSPWPKKKNWALKNLPLAHEWVLLLDADETLPPQAEAEIRTAVTSDSSLSGYWLNRRFFFMGDWLRHAYYPNWNLRLFKHRLGRFEKLMDQETASGDVEIHEHVHVRGRTGRLVSEMDHYAFPSVAAFVEKHNRYSNWEARLALCPPLPGAPLQSWRARGRRWLKTTARHLPCRPLLRFLYVYVMQLGFLDGRRGYYFARLHAYYEFLGIAKTFELRQQPDLSEAPPQLMSGGLALKLVSWAYLATITFFALRSGPRGSRTAGMPDSLARWINNHDALSNYLAFAMLGVFLLRRDPGLSSRAYLRRLALFCGFVVLLETLQLGIPGRVFDLRDIAAGCLGGLSVSFLSHLILLGRKPSSPNSIPVQT